MDQDWTQYMNRVTCASVPNILTTIPKDTIQLTLTSPPFYDDTLYILGDGKEEFNWKTYEEYIHHIQSVIQEIYRITKPGGRLVLILSNSPKINQNNEIEDYWPCLHDTIHLSLTLGWKLQDEAVWIKPMPSYDDFTDSFGPETQLIPHHDWITILRKPGKKSVIKSVKYKETSLWSLPNDGPVKDYNHMYSSFPDILIEKCIKFWTLEEDIILDPYAGSGQTIRVAQEWNRKAIGFEIDKQWINLWEDINIDDKNTK